MPSNNYIYKMSNAGGMATVTRYTDMLAGNTTWNPWEPQGAYDALATVTVPATAVASIEFAGIPNTYKHLQIRGIGITSTAGTSHRIRMNSDTGSNYAVHYLLGDGASASAGSVTSTTNGFISTSPNSTVYPGISVCDILDYSNTNKNKTTRSLGGGDMNGAGGYVTLYSSVWMNTAAITSLTLFPGVGNFSQHSQFTLYGIR